MRRSNALVGDARAVILPGEEDFGLVPLEAAAAGTPTIALRAGGALETIVEGETGVFFDDPNDESLAAAIAHSTARASIRSVCARTPNVRPGASSSV